MVKFLLKKSYSRKDLKEKEFKDLWNAHGVFTTMWIYGKPQKILFFKEHITNLIKSTKNYKIYDRNLKRNIFKIIKSNLNKQQNLDINNMLIALDELDDVQNIFVNCELNFS